MIDDLSVPRQVFHISTQLHARQFNGLYGCGEDERYRPKEAKEELSTGYVFISGSSFRPGARFGLNHVRLMIAEMCLTPGDRLRDCRTGQVWEVQEYNTNQRHEADGTIKHKLVEVK